MIHFIIGIILGILIDHFVNKIINKEYTFVEECNKDYKNVKHLQQILYFKFQNEIMSGKFIKIKVSKDGIITGTLKVKR